MSKWLAEIFRGFGILFHFENSLSTSILLTEKYCGSQG